MSFFFGRRQKSPAEIVRENQRLLNRSIRELDRERTGLEAKDKQTILEIKKLAKASQLDAAKTLAKSLVQIRKNVNKLYKMRAHLQSVSMQLQTLKTTEAMSQAMSGVTKVNTFSAIYVVLVKC